MRYLLLLAFFFAGFAAGAQHFSAGLRGSGNVYMQRTSKTAKPGFKMVAGSSATVAPEAFLRYQGRKSWVAEFALTTDRMQQQYWWAGNTEFQNPVAGNASFSSRSIEAAINLQYEVRCNRMASIPALRNFHSYVGVGMSLSRIQDRNVAFMPNAESGPRNSEYWYHWISLSKTLRYDVNRHFSLQTGAQCGMNSATMFRPVNTGEPALRFSLKLGASYNW